MILQTIMTSQEGRTVELLINSHNEKVYRCVFESKFQQLETQYHNEHYFRYACTSHVLDSSYAQLDLHINHRIRLSAFTSLAYVACSSVSDGVWYSEELHFKSLWSYEIPQFSNKISFSLSSIKRVFCNTMNCRGNMKYLSNIH